ncbi:MAG: hypothetical protein ACT4RN_08595 [Pseudonocardia sp.]
MNAMVIVLLAAGPLFVLVVLAVAIGYVRRVARRGRGAVADLGMSPREDAVSLGFGSLGKGQARGNCTLALDGERLVVAQWVPARTTEIPRDRIVEVDLARTHLGKWVGRDLLRVRFLRPDGAEDTVAFQVRDVPAWVAALRSRP